MDEMTNERHLILSWEAISYLSTIRKWALFFAILGFIACAFLLFAGIVVGAFLSAFEEMSRFEDLPMGLFSVFYVGLGVFYFFPSYFLFRFSDLAKQAIALNDPALLTSSLRYLRSHYVLLGIATILVFVLYILIVAALVLLGGLPADPEGVRA